MFQSFKGSSKGIFALSTLFWLLLLVISRVVPHLANFSLFPVAVICLSSCEKKLYCALMSIVALFISDLILPGSGLFALNLYPMFGMWDIFTYSGLLCWTVAGARVDWQGRFANPVGWSVLSAVSFWLWTNFGTWLISSIYSHDFNGFFACYLAAIPFLQRSLIPIIICICGLHLSGRYLRSKGIIILGTRQ